MANPERLSLSEEKEKRPNWVVIVSSYDFSAIGGGEKSTWNLVQAWETREIKTCLVSPRGPEDSWPFAKVVTLPTANFPLSAHKIPLSSPRLNRILEDLKPTGILLNHPCIFSSVLFLAMKKRWQERTSAIWRSVVWPPLDLKSHVKGTRSSKLKLKESLRPFFTYDLMAPLQRKVASQMRINIAVSEAVASSLVKMGTKPSKIVVCPTQVGGEFTPEERVRYGENWRRRFLRPDELGILLVANVKPKKRLDWALSVYRHLREQRRFLAPESSLRRIRMTVVGEFRVQQYLEYLQEQQERIDKETENLHAAESIQLDFFGPANEKELQSLYNAYDLLLHPSPQEGLPRVVIEALQAGMPVIGRSECLAAREIIERSPYPVGFLPSSPEEAGRVIFRIMTHPDEILPELRENALKWGSCFSAKKSALKVLELITDSRFEQSPTSKVGIHKITL